MVDTSIALVLPELPLCPCYLLPPPVFPLCLHTSSCVSPRHLGMKLLCCRVPLWMKAVLSPPIHPCCSRRLWAVSTALGTTRPLNPVLHICAHHTWPTDKRLDGPPCLPHVYACVTARVTSGDKWTGTPILQLSDLPCNMISSISPAVSNSHIRPSTCVTDVLQWPSLWCCSFSLIPSRNACAHLSGCLHVPAHHQETLRKPPWNGINFSPQSSLDSGQ